MADLRRSILATRLLTPTHINPGERMRAATADHNGHRSNSKSSRCSKGAAASGPGNDRRFDRDRPLHAVSRFTKILVCCQATNCSYNALWASTNVSKYQYVEYNNLRISTDVVRGARGIGIGAPMVAPRRLIALPTDADQRQRLLEIFSVSDRADEPCRTGADYSGLFAGPVGLCRSAHDWGDAADRNTLSGASGGTGGNCGAR